jgi:hypothetical protein
VGSASRPGRFVPPGKTRYPLYRRLGGPQGRSGQMRKISPAPGFDPRTVQPVASRYTNWARVCELRAIFERRKGKRDMRQACSVHVRGLQMSPKFRSHPRAPEGWNNASSTVSTPSVLEWPLNFTVIWHLPVGVCEPLIIVRKGSAAMMLKIVPGIVKQLPISDLCST